MQARNLHDLVLVAQDPEHLVALGSGENRLPNCAHPRIDSGQQGFEVSRIIGEDRAVNHLAKCSLENANALFARLHRSTLFRCAGIPVRLICIEIMGHWGGAPEL